jgi:hypothetical protein
VHSTFLAPTSDQLVDSTVPLDSTNDFIIARRWSSSPCRWAGRQVQHHHCQHGLVDTPCPIPPYNHFWTSHVLGATVLKGLPHHVAPHHSSHQSSTSVSHPSLTPSLSLQLRPTCEKIFLKKLLRGSPSSSSPPDSSCFCSHRFAKRRTFLLDNPIAVQLQEAASSCLCGHKSTARNGH